MRKHELRNSEQINQRFYRSIREIKQQQDFEHRLFKYNLDLRNRNPKVAPISDAYEKDEEPVQSSLLNRKRSQNINI